MKTFDSKAQLSKVQQRYILAHRASIYYHTGKDVEKDNFKTQKELKSAVLKVIFLIHVKKQKSLDCSIKCICRGLLNIVVTSTSTINN